MDEVEKRKDKIIGFFKKRIKKVENNLEYKEKSSEKTKEDVEIEERKIEILDFLKSKANYISYLILALIIFFGYKIRTSNLNLLKDVTTGKFIPSELDSFVILRYVKNILENGFLTSNDLLRYHPFGFNPVPEFSFLSHFIVYLYKFLNIFNSAITIEQVDVLYPAIAFAIASIFFFLLIRKLFDYRVALLSILFLTVIPTFIHRTTAGFSDKESLAIMLMFMALYFYVSAWKFKSISKSVVFGILAGAFTGFTGLVWSGFQFIALILGVTVLIQILFNNFHKKDFYIYTSFFIFLLLVIQIFPSRYDLIGLIFSPLTSIMFLGFFTSLFYFLVIKSNLFKLKDRYLNRFLTKLPEGLFSILFVSVFSLIISTLIRPSFLFGNIKNLFLYFTNPVGTNRWSITVAENHQPYFVDWVGQLTGFFVLLFLIGSVLLFYQLIKNFKAKKFLMITYILFIIAFSMSRYSAGAKFFNGVSKTSQIVYLGSLIAFILIIIISYLYLFYKNKEEFLKINEIKKEYIFVIIWFLVMLVGARGIVRLLITFSTIIVVLVSYLLIKILDYSFESKNQIYKIAAFIFIILMVFAPFMPGSFISFATSTSTQARFSGPLYNSQWQTAMTWVRENTIKDAVFAHWWDYGYWVQYGGERATLSDGGNARGAINYFIGRHVLTGQSETEALELLKANNVTNLLMVSEEIGKYPAFSSIGSDVNYDRYSWIDAFSLTQQQETEDGVNLLYEGGTALDDDFIYNTKLFPRKVSGIAGFMIQIEQENDQITFNKQPIAILVHYGQRFDVPLECIFINNQEINFNEKGLEGCLMFIPSLDENNQVNPIGGALYLSKDVKKGLFTQLYLFDKPSNYFKLVYDDAKQGRPLVLYQGRIFGPLKIWEVSYPDNLEIPEEYYGTEFPDLRVDIINPSLQ